MRRLLPALGLLLLAPLCAEYLVGYDSSTGDPVQLLSGLLFFVPLYGAPALLVREVARRTGMRWPGILALAAALGVLQAGVIDQSLFSESYRDIPWWEATIRPTFVEPLGIAGSNAVGFLVGHIVWSYAVPIALVEACTPGRAERPWLRVPGLVVAALLYLGAAYLILMDHLETETDHASPAQVAGALLVAGLLVAGALTAGRQPPRPAADRTGRAEQPTADRTERAGGAFPKPIVVGAASLVAAFGTTFLPETWLGVAARVAVLAVVTALVLRLARYPRWEGRHVVALAAGALLSSALVGFLVTPLGDVAPVAKYGHNVVFLVGAIALTAWAAHRARSAPAYRAGSPTR